MLGGAAQAAYAQVVARRKAAHRPPKHPVQAGTAEDDLLIAAVVNQFFEEKQRQPVPLDPDMEAAGGGNDVGGKPGLDVIPIIHSGP